MVALSDVVVVIKVDDCPKRTTSKMTEEGEAEEIRNKRAGRIFGEVPFGFIPRSGSPTPPMPMPPPQPPGESSGGAVSEACTVWPRALSSASAAIGVAVSTDRPVTPVPVGPSGAGGGDASPPVQSHWSPDTPPQATSFRGRVDRLRTKSGEARRIGGIRIGHSHPGELELLRAVGPRIQREPVVDAADGAAPAAWTLPPPPSASSPVAVPSPSPAATGPSPPTTPVDPCPPPGQAYFARPRRKISLFPHVDDEPVGPAVPMRPRWDLLPATPLPPPPTRPPPQPRSLRGFLPGPYDMAPGMLLGSFGASGSAGSVSLASGRAPPPQPRRVWMGREAPPPPCPSGDAQGRSSSGWGSWGSRSSGGGVTNSLSASAEKKDEGKKEGKKEGMKKEEKGGEEGR
ncbi:hypothetical protein B0T18DRAFT_428014 [Schizothecium vesticola]|uniref:Uncharacterized protein n=1 Tax=Schizothecium vesticola TaxID=314040 RepID=A0AA40F2F5_9PEZI|nr:hypothetical protein B0T18DRAFT_428014 [Schizothecium vesticola]